MKEITKHRLKQVNRLLKIAVFTFAWLMACVGVTAYSVYWLRQNANYEQETTKRELKPKKASYSDKFQYVYKVKTQTYLSTRLNYSNNTNSYKNYFDMDFSNRPQVDANFSARYVFGGDFGIRRNDSNAYYNRCQFSFLYEPSNDEITLQSILLYEQGNNSSVVAIYDSGSLYLSNIVLLLGNVSRIQYYSLQENQDYGLFNYYFTKIFDYASAYSFNFNDMPNYTQLLTYQVLPNNVFKYNGSTPVTPVDIFYDINVTFESNGQLFDAVRLYCSAVGFTADSNGNITEYSNLLSASTTDFYLTLTAIEYCNYASNTAIQVASIGVLEYKSTYNGHNGTFPVYLTTNGFNWIDSNYKYLSIAPDSINNSNEVSINYINASVCPLLNMKSYQALTFDIADTIIGNNITDIGLSNVFTLMSNAFSGLTGLLAIQILPGFTLGLLVFIPLIVTIIIVVLRLVKK